MLRINVTGGYAPGAIGAIVSLHAKYYAEGIDLGLPLEARIATEISSFLMGMNSERDLFLVASIHGMTVGSLVVDARSCRVGEAHLRWFIAHPLYSPNEIRSALIKEALQFCSAKNYRRIILLTNVDPSVARGLQGDWGFQFTGEIESRDGSRRLGQQVYELITWKPSMSHGQAPR